MNKAILMGRLTKDPEYKQVGAKNTAQALFTLAVDRRYAAQGGERMADFINIVVWGNEAETAAKYLTKGTKIIVEGRIQTRSYDAQDGSKRYATEVVCEHFEFCESKKAETNNVVNAAKNLGFEEIEIVDEDKLPF